MAKATTQIEKRVLSQAEQDARSLSELISAVAQQKDALLVFLDIIGELHASGALEIVQGALKNRQAIGAIGLDQLNKSGAQNLIKNSMSTLQFLGKLDPVKMETMLTSVAAGVEHAVQPADEEPKQSVGLLKLMQQLRDPEVSASLMMLMRFLRGMGEAKQQE